MIKEIEFKRAANENTVSDKGVVMTRNGSDFDSFAESFVEAIIEHGIGTECKKSRCLLKYF